MPTNLKDELYVRASENELDAEDTNDDVALPDEFLDDVIDDDVDDPVDGDDSFGDEDEEEADYDEEEE
jgi:hypothetical protein